MRRKREILAAEDELFEKFWYVCQIFMKKRVESGRSNFIPRVWKPSYSVKESSSEKYQVDIFLPKDDFEWGMINGKLSALHWALGKTWSFLDESLWEKQRFIMRKEWEISLAEDEYFEKVWFGRNGKFVLNDEGEIIAVPVHEYNDNGYVELIAEKYGVRALIIHDYFEWGIWSGRLSALRWIMGDRWDFLDT